jgi:hypothetical protein
LASAGVEHEASGDGVMAAPMVKGAKPLTSRLVTTPVVPLRKMNARTGMIACDPGARHARLGFAQAPVDRCELGLWLGAAIAAHMWALSISSWRLRTGRARSAAACCRSWSRVSHGALAGR